MQRNFKLVFNALLFVSIFMDILILIFLALDFALSLKPVILSLVNFDIIVSLLIILQSAQWIKKQEHKKRYLAKNWIYIPAMIPFAYLIILLSPHMHYLVVILLLFRIYALFKYAMKIKDIIHITEKTRLDYATFVLVGTFVFGSLLFFWVESPVNPQASTLDDAAYFMIVTMSTVGYGNIVPYTGIGRFISVIAIIVGVGYAGWVTAAIATSLIEQLREERKTESEKEVKSMEIILDKLGKIEKELEELKSQKNK
ncbi:MULTISPECIES: ion channel [Methanobacterium]|uniref:Ion channel n=1 Tax=Methanobacterium veterum TaxID=408577 RepID=A0A9E5A942_9EURY|nr:MULTISPECIES: ion channel [Methanobacterium]MCZ3366960.1 ion channel [Methanobacterium veterum]MCZ3373893.1 ion channel [Methanobacterium veterum]